MCKISNNKWFKYSDKHLKKAEQKIDRIAFEDSDKNDPVVRFVDASVTAVEFILKLFKNNK